MWLDDVKTSANHNQALKTFKDGGSSLPHVCYIPSTASRPSSVDVLVHKRVELVFATLAEALACPWNSLGVVRTEAGTVLTVNSDTFPVKFRLIFNHFPFNFADQMTPFKMSAEFSRDVVWFHAILSVPGKDPSVPCDVWTNVNHGTVEVSSDIWRHRQIGPYFSHGNFFSLCESWHIWTQRCN